MPQFSVHRNLNSSSKGAVPFLLNVQNDLMDELATCVVVPLYPAAHMKGKALKTLTPLFEIENKKYVMLTPQLAGIPKRLLGTQVADLSARRDDIVAALDMLITGI